MKKLLLAICAFAMFLPASVFGEMVTINASGTVDLVTQSVLNPLKGKTMTVSFTYKTQATDSNADPNNAVYHDAIQSFAATLDGQNLSSLTPNWAMIEVTNNNATGYDNFAAGSFSEGLNVSFPGLGPYTKATTYFVLRDTDNVAFTDTSLPSSFNLPEMNLQFLSVILQPQTDGLNTRLDATITSFNIIVAPDPPSGVPEPASMLLLGLGLVGLAGVRRKLKN